MCTLCLKYTFGYFPFRLTSSMCCEGLREAPSNPADLTARLSPLAVCPCDRGMTLARHISGSSPWSTLVSTGVLRSDRSAGLFPGISCAKNRGRDIPRARVLLTRDRPRSHATPPSENLCCHVAGLSSLRSPCLPSSPSGPPSLSMPWRSLRPTSPGTPLGPE